PVSPFPPHPHTTTHSPYTTLFRSHPHTAQDDGKEKQQHHAAPQQPQLLSTYREDEVGVTGRQVLRQGGLGLFAVEVAHAGDLPRDRKSTRLNSSHVSISYAVSCLK